MNRFTLIRRSLTFHARAHAGVLIGAAIGSAALIGALVVGDSVRISLRDMALARLGKTQLALNSGDRFFRDQLAAAIQTNIGTNLNIRLASAIQLQGAANSVNDSARANHVQVLGIDSSFWRFADQPPGFTDIPDDSVVINEPLANQLNAKVGDTILIRVLKPSLLSRDAAITPQDDVSVAMRLKVQAVVSNAQLGRFSLRANQVAPFTAFLSRSNLQSRLKLPGKANLMLASGDIDAESADIKLEDSWKLADAELELRPAPAANEIELRSSRVFLDPAKIAAAKAAAPNAQPVLTYFANEIWHDTNTTPYSMIAAMGPPVVPTDLSGNEIIINQWLADDLNAKPGDDISFRYYLLDAGRALRQATNTFRVHSIVPLAGAAADRDLMPDFPGVSDAETTRDWDAGFELETDRIRPKDEQYWKEYRGAPKAFITIAAGRKLWANRFGDTTALRWPANSVNTNELASAILKNLKPAAVGLSFVPAREQALTASAEGMGRYFNWLFIGFSFFLIGAALLLVALLYQFGLEQRSTEIGTFLALGFRPKEVRRLLLREGVALGLFGGVIGAAGGLLYAKAMVSGLTSIWSAAVGSASLEFHFTIATLISGIFGAAIVSALTIWWTLRKQANQSARELLNEGGDAAAQRFDASAGKWVLVIGVLMLLGALGTMAGAFKKGLSSSAEDFFSVGAMVLIGGLLFVRVWFAALNRKSMATGNDQLSMTRGQLSLRNATRRSKRSVATIALLASGTFLVVAIAAFRLDATEDAGKRSSGTGGFALIGESALPVSQNLNTEKGRDFFGLNPKTMDGVSFVPMRVREGDEASCLNLNKAQVPRVVGVKPDQLSGRFTFAGVADGVDSSKPWLALERGNFHPADGKPLGPDEIPCIADFNSLMYALEKSVGGTIDMTDEMGRPFKLRIVGAVANSILQGNLVIDESEFIKRFPGESGYRMFLIDAPPDKLKDVSAALSRGMSDLGIELTSAVDRMNAFNAVQNTYLSTFQVLGGLGLLLGSAGLGVVVLRNVLERRGELALLLAIGYRRRELQRMVLTEHALLLVLGLGLGLITAIIAILPAILSPTGGIPWRSMPITLLAVFLNGAIWTWVATRIALRGELLSALRSE
ncbi:FtsX-like permease family protein [bacterium]|nr:FtsX-like permease family protein [bacterium]